MRRAGSRALLAAGILGLVLAAASPAPAGGAMIQFPIFTSGVIFFVTSGFSTQRLFFLSRPTIFPLIIQPVIVVRPRVFIAPTAVVVLSPIVPIARPILPAVPMWAPSFDSTVAPAVDMTPAVESVDNLARAPELFDRHVLSVTGTVSQLESFVDTNGYPFRLFRFTHDWHAISILVGGQASGLRNGLEVQATGVFYPAGGVPDGWPSAVIDALAVTGLP